MQDCTELTPQIWLQLFTVLIAFGSFLWIQKQWRWKYLTEEWSKLIQFLHQNAKYMNREKARTYAKSFTGTEAVEYELVARLSIAYLDDLYFLGYRKHIRNWFSGSVGLLAGTHRVWLDNNRESYDKGFYAFLVQELDQRAPSS